MMSLNKVGWKSVKNTNKEIWDLEIFEKFQKKILSKNSTEKLIF